MARSVRPCASAALETSPQTGTALQPEEIMALTTASAPALLEAYLTMTEAPSAASDLAMAAPIPLDAPVTIATLPVSLLISLSLFYNGIDPKPSWLPHWAASRLVLVSR